MTSGFIVGWSFNNTINALPDFFAGNSRICSLSCGPLFTNKILEKINFDTLYIIIYITTQYNIQTTNYQIFTI